jgi:hypothetical protein
MAVACFVVLPSPSAMGSPSLSVWNVASVPSPTESWFTVEFVDGQWIALGHTADVAVSPDGSTWAEYPVPPGSWQSVAFGNGQYVALSSVNAGNEEMVSTNGINWTAVAGPSGPWTSLTFGEGRFVAVSSRGQIITSTDGVHWTQVWDHRNYDLTSVTYGDGHFVTVDTAMGATVISANGSDWSRILAPISGLKWSAVVYGNGNFVALDGSGSGYFETSVYGYDWTLHRYSPAQDTDGATFGCGNFVAVGEPTGSTNNIISSSTGATWMSAPVPTDVTSDWTAVGYGAHRFVAVDSAGDIAWSNSAANCAAAIPISPRQVSGNVHNGEVWTYMHPALRDGGAPISSYRVTISNGAVTRQCSAPVFFQPNCIVRGLTNREVYWVTTEAHNRFGFSASSDPEFVIPVASWSFNAVTTQRVIAQSAWVVVQVTGVLANSQGIYPTSLITVHFGEQVAYCHPNPFGECLITIANPAVGATSIYATYTGYGRSYQSPTSHVTITP